MGHIFRYCVSAYLWFFTCWCESCAPKYQWQGYFRVPCRRRETRRGKSYRGSVHAFFKWGPLRVCTHKLFLKILLAYCLRWVLETITSACISPRISITPSFSPGACFCARPLWRVDNACHLPESTQLPANKPAGVTSASPPLISIHTPAY